MSSSDKEDLTSLQDQECRRQEHLSQFFGGGLEKITSHKENIAHSSDDELVVATPSPGPKEQWQLQRLE